ncbi:ATP-binding protein [Brevibacillus ginsengisoli]|uniref:ATP-binding protein n=1 Tax=Brevibacillus ginsengisoli TaxID=363854 RepID=UPI003CF5ECB3
MANYWKDILINISFIILPVFLCLVFYTDRFRLSGNHNQVLTGVLSAISIALCMRFPFASVDGYLFDLRMIPFVLGILYGGFSIGFLLTCFLSIYRFFLGGAGVIPTMIVTNFVLFALYRLIPLYHRLTIGKKLLMTTLIGFIGSCIHNLFFLYSTHQSASNIVNRIDCILLQTFCMFFVTLMVERLRENAALKDRLHRSEKLRVVSEMAASVSHEIRNPLTVTRGFIQFLLIDELPEDKRKEYLKLSLDEINRAESIITDYLTLAKPQLESIVPLNLTDEIQYVVDVMAPFATLNNIQMESYFTNDCVIQGDRQKFHQCLINLVKNGIEAMPDGGTITIGCCSSNKQAQIEIKDTGVGMTKEQISRLGTPYYSTKEKGTGLGTMVAFHIVHVLKGKIHIESQLGRGTSFVISIPTSS